VVVARGRWPAKSAERRGGQAAGKPGGRKVHEFDWRELQGLGLLSWIEQWKAIGISMALIKIKESKGASDLRVCVVSGKAGADLLVCIVESRNVAKGKDELWCFTDSASAADSSVCFVESRSLADLLLYFVESRGVAGWQRSHRLQGKGC
jgi:hypothetical protein